MKSETESILYRVYDKLKEMRTLLDDYMYRGGSIPEDDQKYCRKIYDSICKTLDLL